MCLPATLRPTRSRSHDSLVGGALAVGRVNMLPCFDCAYRAEVPGNAHIAREYAWRVDQDQIPRGNPHGIRMGWFYFPVLFDPTWGPDVCPALAVTRDPDKVRKGGAVELLARFLLR